MTWQEWTDGPYDGAPHPDRSRTEDHDDVSPIPWAEWQADRRRVSSGDAPPQTSGVWLSDAEAVALMNEGDDPDDVG